MLFCLAFSLFVACLPHSTGTGIIQYTLARLYQQLKVHRHGQIGFLSFCLFAQLGLIAHCSPFAVPGNTPCIVSFIQIPTRLIHQQCPFYFHCRFTFWLHFPLLLHTCRSQFPVVAFYVFPFCCIFAAGLFFWCPVLGAFNAESFAFPPSKRSGVQFQAVFRRFPFPNTHVHATPKVLTYLTER